MKKKLLDIYIPLTINLIAGVILFFGTKNTTNALILFAIVEFIIIIYLIYRNFFENIIPGVKEYSDKFDSGYNTSKILDEVSQGFDFLGISCRTLLIDDTFVKRLIETAKGKVVYRFLILNPYSQYVSVKANEEGDINTIWESEINASLERLKSLRSEHRLNIQIRLYDSYPVLRQITINNTLMYMSWYPSGQRGSTSPLIKLDNSKKSIFHPMKSIFEQLWNSSQEVI